MSSQSAAALDTLLAKTVDALTESQDIPRLGIQVSLTPGRHWLFHPRLLNMRWWWDELVEQADLVRVLLIRAWAHDWHDSALDSLTKSRAALAPQVSEHIVTTRRLRNQDTLDVITKLFSLREKIAWLVYELSNISWNISIPPRRVGYNTVRDKLKQAATLHSSDVHLHQLRALFLSLSDEDMEALFEFRHGLVHRIGVDIDDSPEPLFIEVEPGKWDTIPMGKTRARYLLHLALHAWRQLAKGMREMTRIPLPTEYLRLYSLPVLEGTKPTQLDAIHAGIRLRTEFGDMIIRCMKRCTGFKSRLALPYFVNEDDRDLMIRLGDEIKDKMLKAVPEFAPERGSGTFKCVLTSNESRSSTIVDTYLTSTYAAERHVSAATAVVERLNDEFSGEKVDFVTHDHYIQNAQPFCCWPAVVQQRLIRLIDGDSSPPIALSETHPSGDSTCTLHIVFPTGEQEETNRILNVKSTQHFAFLIRRESTTK